jgi:small subunit ribosomal protein S20
MANHVSALKRIRVTQRRTVINRMRKSRMRHQIRALRRLLDQNNASAAEELLPKTFSIIDRAAKWGIIHSNTADRYKARLNKRLKAISTTTA